MNETAKSTAPKSAHICPSEMKGEAKIEPKFGFDNSQSKLVKISKRKMICIAGRFGVIGRLGIRN